MTRILFENRKAAMLFAGVILLLTQAMVGTREQEGVLDTAAEQIRQNRAAASAQEPQQFAEDPVQVAPEHDRDTELSAQNEDVFGDFGSSEPAPAADAFAPAPPQQFAQAQARPFRPDGPIGGPVRADGPGIAVPHPDDAREAAASSQIPVAVVRTPKSAPQ
jgi:hypothetical protein